MRTLLRSGLFIVRSLTDKIQTDKVGYDQYTFTYRSAK